MANFIVSYDLNGPSPSHKQMDDHLRTLGANRGRILETVWWVSFPGTAAALHGRVRTILRPEDRLAVFECKSAAWVNLLVDSEKFKLAFEAAA